MQKTAIGWTDFSANPLKYRDAAGAVKWACAKVSAGCTNCYSEALALRWNRGAAYNAGEVAKLTPFLDEKELRQMLTSKAIAGKRVFVGDMTDVFGEWVSDELLDRLFTLFVQRGEVIWQVLTKRAERARDYLTGFSQRTGEPWPVRNVWIGVSVENQERAHERIPHLLQTPAGIRFVSAEPLLSPVAFSVPEPEGFYLNWLTGEYPNIPGIDWLIVGGESGPRYRDCGVAPIVNVTRQCQAAKVPVFVKQDAHRLPGQQGRIPDEFWLKEFPS